jgi:hypothetical protein
MKKVPSSAPESSSLSFFDTQNRQKNSASRREWLRQMGIGAAALPWVSAGVGSAQAQSGSSDPTYPGVSKGEQVTITKVKAILTCPQGQRLCVVKVETSDPGLYGIGCATFNQRALPVAVAVEEFLDPFARGRNVDQIEDLWQNAYTSSYWRNGPVLNNALSGFDQALWDIKGKRVGHSNPWRRAFTEKSKKDFGMCAFSWVAMARLSFQKSLLSRRLDLDHLRIATWMRVLMFR